MKDKYNKWIKAAGVRAVKTMSQCALALMGASAIVQEVDWRFVLSACAMAGMASILTSVVGLPEVEE